MQGIWDIIVSIFKFVQGLGTLFMGVIALFIIAIIAMIPAGPQAPNVPDGAVMVLSPRGTVVEVTRIPDPMESLFADYNNAPPEISVHDIITAINRAKDDGRISGIALITDQMMGAGPSHLHDMANALKSFRESGKPIYAVSSGYSQGDYLLASQADKIFLNPAGSLLLTGYGRYTPYFKELLAKVGANVNVFRVGTFKSAVEPFLRDDMSPAAKEANLAYMGSLWSQYVALVGEGRKLKAATIQAQIEGMSDNLKAAGGDFATLALNNKLVDEIASRSNWRRQLKEKHGSTKDGSTFKQIHFEKYLAATHGMEKSDGKAIAIIIAQGEIVMGSGPANIAAAETVVRHIRNARNNKKTAAIVLRVDSPGGSVFASELIRQELLTAQEDGIPVVASFGPYAASGGYWISANADEIWASPATVTGSIGIFGIIPTFENTLAKVGVHTDGVGTTSLAGAFDVTRPLSDMTKDIIQQSITAGYSQFLNIVAEGRGMTVEDVDKIAQGRVWDGLTAKKLGLVDQLGTLDDAVAAAARRADITSYHPVLYRDGPTKFEALMLDMLNGNAAIKDTLSGHYSNSSVMMKAAYNLKKDLEFLTRFNDPMGSYSLCLTCGVR